MKNITENPLIEEFKPVPTPWPWKPHIPTPQPWYPSDQVRTCPKCNMRCDGPMGYACPNHDCPIGLGPVLCSMEIGTYD